jgi:hypothetical protein
MSIRIIENTDPSYEQFLKLPDLIYRDDPNHRPRPAEQTRVLVDKAENPCWKHARQALFLAERNGKAVGRIAAFFDQKINSQHGRNEGFFGFFECIEDPAISVELFDSASHWLTEQGGCTSMRGPCTPFPDFYNFGILVEGFGKPQVTGEAFNPEYYPTLIEGCGFARESEYLSYWNKIQNNKTFDRMMNRLEKILRKSEHASIRSFDVGNFHRDAAIVNDIINRSFESGCFYSMVDLPTQEFMLKNTVPLHDMQWFSILEVDGQSVGVNLLAPNHDELIWGETIRGVRAENFAILPEFQGSLAASFMFFHGWDKIRRAGYQDVFLSYISEENRTMHHFAKSFGCELSKRHRIYSKHL